MRFFMIAALSTVFGSQASSSALESDEVGLFQSKLQHILQKSVHATKLSPYKVMPCSGTPVLLTPSLTYDMYDTIVKQMRLMYNALPTTCDVHSCPRGDLAGCAVRTVGHDFMDGSPDGCIALDDPDNRGIQECLVSLADVYASFCLRVSLADFLVISAEAIMNFTRERVLEEDPSRSPIDFRSNFKYGRMTNKECAWAYGLMPQAEGSCNEVDEVLGRRVGLSRELSAALLGVHTLGRADLNNSGYEGSWVGVQSIDKFDNGYYQSMVLKGWTPRKNVGGNPDRNQWQRVDTGYNEVKYGKEMMLNTDLCLLYFAIDQDSMSDLSATKSSCNCAWSAAKACLETIEENGLYCGLPYIFTTRGQTLGGTVHDNANEFYGHKDQENFVNFTKQRLLCCGMQPQVLTSPINLTPSADCGNPGLPAGRWKDFVLEFARDESKWLEKFRQAWQIATSNGHSLLSPMLHVA